MNKASILADAIGRKKIAEAFGVGLTAVSNHAVRGYFPASWYLGMLTLADSASGPVECTPELFQMKQPYQVNGQPECRQSGSAQG
jgi:hypothetical protein